MKRIAFFLVGFAMLIALIAFTAPASDERAASIFVTNIPPGYRDWTLISVAHEEGNLHSSRASDRCGKPSTQQRTRCAMPGKLTATASGVAL